MSVFRRNLMLQNSIRKQIMDSCLCWYDIKKQGCTNDSMSSNPVLKDFSGKNHDMQLYNFAWSGMSGIGGYNYDFLDWWNDGIDTSGVEMTKNSTEMIWTSLGTRLTGNIAYQYFTDGRTNLDEINLYVENVPKGANMHYYVSYGPMAESLTPLYSKLLVTGVNTIPAIADIPVSDKILVRIEIQNNDISDLSENPLIVRQVPQYPNALVSDGVNNYGSCENFPLQDDFTIIAKRHRISNGGCLISKKIDTSYGGAFLFEGQTQDVENGFVDSFGARTNVNWAEDDIVYMTPTSYNGTPITKGTDPDHNRLNLFMVWNNYYLSAALYKLLIFNRTLSDEEIQWVKLNLIEDVEDDYLVDAWFMSDYDNSDNITGFTINGIKGTELTPKNFAFNGSSGFGKYSFNAPALVINQDGCTTVRWGYKYRVTANADLENELLYPVSINIKNSNLPLYTPIRVRALTDKGLSIRDNTLKNVILNLENKGDVGEFYITKDMANGVLHFKTKGNTVLASNEMFAWEFLPDYKYPPYNFIPYSSAVSGKRVFKFDPNIAVSGSSVPGIHLKNPTSDKCKFKFKLEGVDVDQPMSLYFNPGTNFIYNKNLVDGEYEVDFNFSDFGVDVKTQDVHLYLCYLYPQKEYYNTTITIEPIGTYDGTLCFDGVNDYLINDPYTLPLLDDYTIICRREIENDSNDPNSDYCVISKSLFVDNGAFVFENDNRMYSFGTPTTVTTINKQESVSYQTKSSYNGKIITVGDAPDQEQFMVGAVRLNDSRLLKGNIKYIALYNKSLTPLQIEKEIKKLEEKWQNKLESKNSISLIS